MLISRKMQIHCPSTSSFPSGQSVAQALEVDAGVEAQEEAVAAVVPVLSEALLVVLQNHAHWFLPLVAVVLAEDHLPEIPNLLQEVPNLKEEVLNQ
jgi:hypothetical protein